MVEEKAIAILMLALIGAIGYASATGRYQAVPIANGFAIVVIDTILGSTSYCRIPLDGGNTMNCEPVRR